MFGLFGGNKEKKLQKQYQAVLKEAMEAQRSGNIRLYSELTEKANTMLAEIELGKKAAVDS